jgi:PAS domain S-box-containing protein
MSSHPMMAVHVRESRRDFVVGPATVFLLISALLFSAGRGESPQLHTVLDTGACLLSGMLAISLWKLGARTNQSLLTWLAGSFATTALLELVHVAAIVEWTGRIASFVQLHDWLRPATWPPAAHILPIGILCAIWLARGTLRQALEMASTLLLLGAALLTLFYFLPRYSAPDFYGISRPTLLFVPPLWAVVGLVCWRMREANRIYPALTGMATLMCLGHIAMLYSGSPHDVSAMVAHVGKLCGYLTLQLAMMRMASSDAFDRAHSEAELIHSNSTLEERVRQRTAELQATNTNLQVEVATRHQAELALADSELRTRSIVETALDGVITMDHLGRITEFSPGAERIFEYPRNSVIGQQLEEKIIPVAQREAHQRGLARYLASRETVVLGRRIELTGLRSDGSTVPIELSINRMPGAGPPLFAAYVRDITERRTAIANLERTEVKLRTQLGRMNLLDQTTRAIGNRQDLPSIFRVVLSSLEDHLPIDFGCMCLCEPQQAALSVTCVGPRSQALQASMNMAEQDRIEIDENGLGRCMRGELVYESDIGASAFDFPARLALGGMRSVVIAPLIVESRVFGIMVAARCGVGAFGSAECEFLRQLSEHVALATHQAQLHASLQSAFEELRQTQHVVMQHERLRAVGEMASGIAHDINNALSPAALYVQSLLEQETSLSPEARNDLAVIQRSIDDVARTIARMREFSRPRERELVPAPVNLNEVLQQVADVTRARWSDIPREHGIVVTMDTDFTATPPNVMGAENEIRDAFTNLVLNAVDALPTGGTVTLRSRIVPGATLPGRGRASDQVQIEVCDTGVGMSEATRSRCLEPFFTTKGERGTGLGLAMVYGMAQRHGATLEVRSELGEGTTMSLTFPSRQITSTLPQGTPHALQPLRILFVDDDPVLLRSLQVAFERDGHAVSVADGGQTGIDTFVAAQQRGEGFAVVVTDLGMPYVDGRTVAAAIKEHAPITPVILLTGWGHRMNAENEFPEHVDRVLSKPPNLGELRTAIAQLTHSPVPRSSELLES